MLLEELIAVLTTAQEQAADGDWESVEDRVHDSRHIVCASCTHPNARAIAVRHNTAGEVLEELKRHRDLQGASGFWGRAAARAANERDDWELRAEKAEDRSEIQRVEIRRLRGQSPHVSEVVTDGDRIIELECRVLEGTQRAEKAEAKVTEMKTDSVRLDAGWHEANGRALEVGLERTRLKACLDARNACYLCKVAIEPAGTPESRVPRCSQCPEPESVPDGPEFENV